MPARMLTATALVALLTSCAEEPVHDQEVKALGDERPGFSQDEFHRAGQPCVTCHGEFGPAKTRFAFAGTIFTDPQNPVGAAGVTVNLLDDNQTTPSKTIVTNCVGNFFIAPEDWPGLAFPVLVKSLEKDQEVAPSMISHIGRERSCNQCHQDEVSNGKLSKGFDRPGHIVFTLTEAPTPCPNGESNIAALGQSGQ